VLPIWYRPDLFCAFHQGAPGHDTEHCHPLKEEVQKLIENNAWSFDDLDLKVLNQQQYPTSHFLAATVKNLGYQPQSQQGQQQYLSSHSVNVMSMMNVVLNLGYQPQSQQSQQPPRQQAPRTQIDPIPMKYADLFPRLLERNLIHTKSPLSIPAILPAGYRADLSCAFHQGAPGHDIEECFALQKIVQKLVRKNLIPFEEFEFEGVG